MESKQVTHAWSTVGDSGRATEPATKRAWEKPVLERLPLADARTGPNPGAGDSENLAS